MSDAIAPIADPVPADNAGAREIGFSVPARYNASEILFANLALGRGDRLAVTGPAGRRTYRELCADAARWGNALLALGLRRGDRVLMFLDDTPCYPAAFFGAAIPTHLLTREAMALYLRKLKPSGIVALHVSNYHLELGTVVASVAHANDAITRLYDGGDVQEEASEQKWIPTVAAVARKDEDFGALAKSKYWPILPPDPAQRIWTDDYSNVLGALIRRLRQRNE